MPSDAVTLTPFDTTPAERAVLTRLSGKLAGLKNGGLSLVGTRSGPYNLIRQYSLISTAMCVSRHKVVRRSTGFVLEFSGVADVSPFSQPSEVPFGGNYELKVALCPISSGTTKEARIPVYFGGRRIGLCQSGSNLLSDPLEIELPAGKEFYLYTWVNRQASSAYSSGGESGRLATDQPYFPNNTFVGNQTGWLTDCGMMYTSSTGINPFTTYDLVDSGEPTLGIWTNCTVPSAILARVLDATGPAAVAVIGDSILNGSNDFGSALEPYSGNGYAVRAAGVTNPTYRATIGGNMVSEMVGSNSIHWPRRLARVAQCDVAFVGLGTNDLVSRTAVQVMDDLSRLIDMLQVRGVQKIVLATIIPRTTSSDNWTTEAGQSLTPVGFEAKRLIVNDWIRSLPNGVVACADVTPAVESTTLPGRWKAPGTAQGTITTTAGSTTTVINTTGLTPSAEVGKSIDVSGTFRRITANTATTITLQSALGGAPAAGVVCPIWNVYTDDGIHPVNRGHAAMAPYVPTQWWSI